MYWKYISLEILLHTLVLASGSTRVWHPLALKSMLIVHQHPDGRGLKTQHELIISRIDIGIDQEWLLLAVLAFPMRGY